MTAKKKSGSQVMISIVIPVNDVAELIIEARCERWEISWWWLIWKDRPDLQSLLRYLKMRLAIRETRNRQLKVS